MPIVSLDLADKSYAVHVENGILDRTGDLMKATGIRGKIVLITNETIAPLYEERIIDSLQKAGFKEIIRLHAPDGENSKSLSQVESLCSALAKAGIDRKGTIIALGGGVIGDLAGFVASIYYRGIPFVQIPTTIVSQVDSSVGGKTGVNLTVGKNLVGAFHHPKLVIADPLTLASLPHRVLVEGLAEVVKHAIIRDEDMLDLLERLSGTWENGLDEQTCRLLPELISRNVAIKARIVEADEKETLGLRALLNFGHTIGHGIEAAVPYGEILHGEAVSLGIRAALHLSVKHAGLEKGQEKRILGIMDKMGLPLVLPSNVNPRIALEKLMSDKKFENGSIRFVLTDRPGSAFVAKDLTYDDMKDGLEILAQKWYYKE